TNRDAQVVNIHLGRDQEAGGQLRRRADAGARRRAPVAGHTGGRNDLVLVCIQLDVATFIPSELQEDPLVQRQRRGTVVANAGGVVEDPRHVREAVMAGADPEASGCVAGPCALRLRVHPEATGASPAGDVHPRLHRDLAGADGQRGHVVGGGQIRRSGQKQAGPAELAAGGADRAGPGARPRPTFLAGESRGAVGPVERHQLCDIVPVRVAAAATTPKAERVDDESALALPESAPDVGAAVDHGAYPISQTFSPAPALLLPIWSMS